jgi:hypothetical protein
MDEENIDFLAVQAEATNPHGAHGTSHHYATSNSSKNVDNSVHGHGPSASIGTRHSAKSSQNKMKKDNLFAVHNDRVRTFSKYYIKAYF